jgi:hypothetical protein
MLSEAANRIGALFSGHPLNSRNQVWSRCNRFLVRYRSTEVHPMPIRAFHLSIPAVAMVAGTVWAVQARADTVQIINPAPAQNPSHAIIAPTVPPPPRVETIPPPPSEEARVMYWRPGHWMWDGANWAWAPGRYVDRPFTQAVWEPGHWVQQPTGGYIWVEGHWQG